MGATFSTPSNAPLPQSEAQILQAYTKYLPGAAAATEAQIGPTSAATTAATKQAEPALNALNLQQLQQYGLPEAQIGQQISNSNALAGAQTNLNQINGAGGQAATAGANLETQLSPGYRGANEAVNAINLGGLSPGESAATERSLNQSNVGTGNLGLLNPENTVNNALNFGGAFNSKVGLMDNAVSAANGTGFSPVNLSLGQPQPQTLGNFGTSQLSPSTTGTSAGSTGTAFNFGSGLLNQATALNSSNNALSGQLGSTAMNTSSPEAYYASTMSALGSACCFIFLEAYHGKIPAGVRRGRDKFYFKNHDIATGYRRVAKWLVPAMQRSKIVRVFVWRMMVNPITKDLINPMKVNKLDRFITHSWLKLWAMLGKGHKESEYSMTWRYE